MREPSSYLAEFAERFAALGIEAVLIGTFAALRYRADPRMTTDVDFLVRSATGLAEALRAEGYEVREMAEPDAEPYALFVRGKGAKVDVLVAETAYQEAALDRAVDGALAPEDVIVDKLIAWRPRGRDDIASILRAGVALDEDYVLRWSEEWAVADRWETARRAR